MSLSAATHGAGAGVKCAPLVARDRDRAALRHDALRLDGAVLHGVERGAELRIKRLVD